jgi:hypothetical protein
VVTQGAPWRIGSGANIPFLGAHWLKDGPSLSITNPIFEPLLQVKLCEFIDQDLKVWKAPLIYNLFDARTAQFTLTHCFILVAEDKLIWKGEKRGKYYARSALFICVSKIVDNFHLHVPDCWNLISR